VQFILLREEIKKSEFSPFHKLSFALRKWNGFQWQKGEDNNDSLVTLYHGKYFYKDLVGGDKNTKDWRFKTKWNEFHFTLPST